MLDLAIGEIYGIVFRVVKSDKHSGRDLARIIK